MNVAVRSKSLDILSICTGGGGLDLGFELAVPGARSVCMVEREGFAVAQLVSAMEAGLLAPAPIWSDARTFNGRAWRGAVDGLIGGIPCQPHSLAGRKRGQNDERDLWSDARRIIVQSGAWFVLIENVSGMLSAGDDEIAGAERVHRDLRKLGFEVEGGLFTAAEVGASHQRERVFILGVSGGGLADAYSERLEGQRADVRAIGRTDAWRSARLCDGTALDNTIGRRRPEGRHDHGSDERNEPDATGEYALEHATRLGRREGRAQTSLRSGRDAIASAERPMVHAISGGRAGRAEVEKWRSSIGIADERPGGCPLFPPGPSDLSSWRDILSSAPELEPAFRRVADGLASRLDIARVDRLRMLGNGVVPLQAAYAIRTLSTRLAARGAAGAARLVRMMERVAA